MDENRFSVGNHGSMDLRRDVGGNKPLKITPSSFCEEYGAWKVRNYTLKQCRGHLKRTSDKLAVSFSRYAAVRPTATTRTKKLSAGRSSLEDIRYRYLLWEHGDTEFVAVRFRGEGQEDERIPEVEDIIEAENRLYTYLSSNVKENFGILKNGDDDPRIDHQAIKESNEEEP